MEKMTIQLIPIQFKEDQLNLAFTQRTPQPDQPSPAVNPESEVTPFSVWRYSVAKFNPAGACIGKGEEHFVSEELAIQQQVKSLNYLIVTMQATMAEQTRRPNEIKLSLSNGDTIFLTITEIPVSTTLEEDVIRPEVKEQIDNLPPSVISSYLDSHVVVFAYQSLAKIAEYLDETTFDGISRKILFNEPLNAKEEAYLKQTLRLSIFNTIKQARQA